MVAVGIASTPAVLSPASLATSTPSREHVQVETPISKSQNEIPKAVVPKPVTQAKPIIASTTGQATSTAAIIFHFSMSATSPNYLHNPATVKARAVYVGVASICSTKSPNPDSVYRVEYGDGTSSSLSYEGCATGDDGDVGEHSWAAATHTYTGPGTYTAVLYRDEVIVGKENVSVKAN